MRINLRPVNPSDVFSVMGMYPGFAPKSFPAVPGTEGVGIIEALGPDASGRLALGQRVVSFDWGTHEGNGSWQQYIVITEEKLVPVPDGVSDEAAAMALVNPVAMIGMVDTAAIPEGEWLLITAAGSFLGRLAISYAKTINIKTIGTVRRKEQVQELLDFGCSAVVVSTDDSWPEQVMDITGRKGAYAAVDSVAGTTTRQCTAALRDYGEVYVYGAMSGVDVSTTVEELLYKCTVVKGFWLVKYLNLLPVAERQAKLAKALDLFKAGVFTPFVGQVFPLEKAAEAVAAQGKEARGGKVLLQG